MANPAHLEILERGVEAWNEWRAERDTPPDLRKARLRGYELPGIDLRNAKLSLADLCGADLKGAELEEARCRKTNLEGADLEAANLKDCELGEAILDGAALVRADLTRANLTRSTLREANLRDAALNGADIFETRLDGAKLCRANLAEARIRGATLVGCDLEGALLQRATILGSSLEGANLNDCSVYGASVWGAALGDAKQTNLRITLSSEPTITVDNLAVAQFVYLLLKNEKIRDVIDTVTSRSVLILGRFTGERKEVLEAVRAELRKKNLVPILFDWPPSRRRDLTETVQMLASMARFVVADVSEARSIPQELSSIVPNFPSVPVQPIILASQRSYELFEHWRRFTNVLPEFRYEDTAHLLANLDGGVIGPVERWEDASDKAAARERAMRDTVERQRAEIDGLRALVERGG